MKTVLYIHGMGGGADSRIPSILNNALSGHDVRVCVRTYSFDPESATSQISSWVEELRPDLIVGESLGSIHAIRIKGIPHVLVSPSLNAPLYFGYLSWLTLIPGVTCLLDKIYRPREGDRQTLYFTFKTMKKYLSHRRAAIDNSPRSGSTDYFFAFFGTRDHYRKSGIVSIRTWKKYFGNNFSIYDGTHFMEEEYIYSMLAPCVLKLLK